MKASSFSKKLFTERRRFSALLSSSNHLNNTSSRRQMQREVRKVSITTTKKLSFIIIIVSFDRQLEEAPWLQMFHEGRWDQHQGASPRESQRVEQDVRDNLKCLSRVEEDQNRGKTSIVEERARAKSERKGIEKAR